MLYQNADVEHLFLLIKFIFDFIKKKYFIILNMVDRAKIKSLYIGFIMISLLYSFTSIVSIKTDDEIKKYKKLCKKDNNNNKLCKILNLKSTIFPNTLLFITTFISTFISCVILYYVFGYDHGLKN